MPVVYLGAGLKLELTRGSLQNAPNLSGTHHYLLHRYNLNSYRIMLAAQSSSLITMTPSSASSGTAHTSINLFIATNTCASIVWNAISWTWAGVSLLFLNTDWFTANFLKQFAFFSSGPVVGPDIDLETTNSCVGLCHGGQDCLCHRSSRTQKVHGRRHL